MILSVFTAAGLSAALVALVGCSSPEGELALVLPPTPVLQIATRWAVVDVEVLRLRDAPDAQTGRILSWLPQGARVEVITQKRDTVEVDGETGRWYQVNHNGMRGWIFGAYMTEVTVPVTHVDVAVRPQSTPSTRPDPPAGS